MNTQIHYGNFKKSQELENLLVSQVSRFDHLVDDKTKTEIWINNETNLVGRGSSMYLTKILLVRPDKKNYFVAKSDSDIFSSIRKSVKTIKSLLCKE